VLHAVVPAQLDLTIQSPHIIHIVHLVDNRNHHVDSRVRLPATDDGGCHGDIRALIEAHFAPAVP